jgi:hypothetical protein
MLCARVTAGAQMADPGEQIKELSGLFDAEAKRIALERST